MNENAKGQVSKNSIIGRCYDLLLFLHQPHTVIEIGVELGVTKYCVYDYLKMVEGRFPLMSRKRLVEGSGANPREYWIDYLGWSERSANMSPEMDSAIGVMLHIVKRGFNGEVDG